MLIAIASVLATFTAQAQEVAGGQTQAQPVDVEPQVHSVIVTAQKRSEEAIHVPVSMMAMDQETLDRLGAKDISDIARMVPGLSVQGSDDVGNINIAIRGISSTVGAATTGIYIDDVPIQVRQNSAVWGNLYPHLFDLDRVEVLRGPQGTLFGAGAEGGAVRFITPDASLRTYSGLVTSELFFTEHGDPGHEIGVAGGGPLVDGTVGVRASVWQRSEGGYADRLDPATGDELAHRGNSTEATVARLVAKIKVSDDFIITPSVFYQHTKDADMGLFSEAAGSYSVYSQIAQPHDDEAALYTLTADYNLGPVDFKSISSYINRTVREEYDSTGYELNSLLYYETTPVINLSPRTGYITVPFDPNYLVDAHYVSKQTGITQELRLTSNDEPGSRLSWVAGLFFQRSQAGYDPLYQDNNLNALANYISQQNGNGPGTSASVFGEAPIAGLYSYVDNFVSVERDLAVYGNLTYALTPALKVAAGLRVARSAFEYSDTQDGPWGPGAPFHQQGSQSETPITPRVNATYQIDQDRMVYTSIAKGYRIGGANEPLPASCNGDLAALGLTSTPSTYKSDSLWSYEAGMKGRFLGGSLQVESSVYWINWDQIQQSIYLNVCGYNFIGNLGSAHSRGFDTQVEWSATRHLVLSFTAGVTDATYAQTVVQDGTVLARDGDHLSMPGWSYTAGVEYRYVPWAGADGYTRVDTDVNGSYNRTPSDGVFGADPMVRDAPATHFTSVRSGARFNGWDTALYCNNLFNADTSLYRTHNTLGSPDLRDSRPRPRTIGIEAQYHF